MNKEITLEEILLHGKTLTKKCESVSEIQHETYKDTRKEIIYSDEEGNCWIEVITTVAPELNNRFQYIHVNTLNRIIKHFK